MPIAPFHLNRVRAFPLAERRSLSRINDILVAPQSPPQAVPPVTDAVLAGAAAAICAARQKNAAVMLIYGAHLLRNGAGLILGSLIRNGWITHLATNGAGAIHDWEYAFLGRSTESVRENVPRGCFGTWDETSRFIHLALMAGALDSSGFGRALGQFIHEERLSLPAPEELAASIRANPEHPLTPARADLLQTLRKHQLPAGEIDVPHPWKSSSIAAQAFAAGVPWTVHPGIGYDIISNHPIFNGAVLGRAAEQDFKLFAGTVEQLDGGVVLSIGSAVMGPQVFEKTLSCVNNVRLQEERAAVSGHSIFVVDLQEGGQWDWTQGEPDKTNPAYYLRFCKSYARMGGSMHYACCDNLTFIHHLCHRLASP